ncbi:hypothetical protein COY62_02845 [bacterium (Candidatus Howlettbacteria) CG_4_10_14_0_8_um_filter_40_9]|nr:MAG: hypothetical protein COY62_02845 [bacterium (Candidatus Howlettbacteria) CG_4_10_14_0_8_um_filter_40_9]
MNNEMILSGKWTKISFAFLGMALLTGIVLDIFRPTSNGMITIAVIASLLGAFSTVMLVKLNGLLTKVPWWVTIVLVIAVSGWLIRAFQFTLLFSFKWFPIFQAWFQSSPPKP